MGYLGKKNSQRCRKGYLNILSALQTFSMGEGENTKLLVNLEITFKGQGMKVSQATGGREYFLRTETGLWDNDTLLCVNIVFTALQDT